jgi:hypothetical protein
VSLEVCLVGPQATSNRTSEDENTVGIGCRHRRSSCDWTRDFILRRILPLTYRIPHLTCDPRRLILYYTAYPAHPIPHISSGIHGSSLVPSHLKLKEEVKGEQGLAALALGKFEEVYEIEGGS